MIILGRRRTAKNLADEIYDGVASSTQFTNDLEFCRWFLMVRGRNMPGRAVSDKTERFAEEGNSLANDVTVGKNILDVGGEGRVLLGGGRRPREVVRVGGSIGCARNDLRKGRGRKRGGR